MKPITAKNIKLFESLRKDGSREWLIHRDEAKEELATALNKANNEALILIAKQNDSTHVEHEIIAIFNKHLCGEER